MKVTFDGANKLITVDNGITSLDVQIDIYSDWKEWVQANSNAGFLAALRTIGGDPTVGIKSVAPYFFLMNGWKIRPYEGNHTLNIAGNLFVDDPETYGSNIVVPTIGNYQVLVNMSTTSDAIVLVSGSGVTEEDKADIANRIEQVTGQPIKSKTETLPDHPADEASVQAVLERIGIPTRPDIAGDLDEIDAKVELVKAKTDTIEWEDVTLVRQIEEGRWKIENNQMIFYKADNVTELARFDLYRADGEPSETDVVERRRV